MPSPRQSAQIQSLLALLSARGMSSSAAIQATMGLSQPTVSRLLALADDDVVVCGQGKSTRYAVAQPIGVQAAQQPIWMLDEQGAPSRMATLSFLAKGQLHVGAESFSQVFEPSPLQPLPWYLSPLRAQGFLGRLLAQRLAAQGLAANPEQWGTEAVLLAALHTPDAPGALWLGGVADGRASAQGPVFPADSPGAALDAVASDVASTLPFGSSAGGEQPKFTAMDDQGAAWLVKFSPPLGTPFGDRWADLLEAEALCSQVLAQRGHATAESRTVRTETRAYVLSRRFDRVGAFGRRHVVSVGAAHAGFVTAKYQNWAVTGRALTQQRRLSADDTQQLQQQLEFGRLIGNTDMHAGNASLWVAGHTLADMAQGQFTLAPVYDMLPMRWRPDPMLGLQACAPFEVDLDAVTPAMCAAARDFWHLLATQAPVSAALKAVAATMAERMRRG